MNIIELFFLHRRKISLFEKNVPLYKKVQVVASWQKLPLLWFATTKLTESLKKVVANAK